MGKMRGFHIELIPVIEELRKRGLSDNLILQTFQLLLEGSPVSLEKPKEKKIVTSIAVDIYEGEDKISIKGNPEGLLHGIAAMMVAYRERSDSTYGEALADVILEVERINDHISEIKEEDSCQDNMHY